ncbi:MAG: DUF2855 family protein [Bacteroidota bacterium]
MLATQFQVRRNDFLQHRLVTVPSQALQSGDLRVRIEAFSYTANNITYALMGERMRYWQFFAPVGEEAEAWGLIPVWGFAEVTESNGTDLAVGERLFCYFPPATDYVMRPTQISGRQFMEGSAQRADLPASYNVYRRLTGEKDYNPAFDRERMLFYPLHITSYFIWDQIKENDWYGAEQLVLLSASSKTSTGLAYALTQDASAPRTIGLTSGRNLEKVQTIGWYDEVLSYEQLDQIDPKRPTAIVDFSGQRAKLAKLYTHLGEQFRYLIRVGLTHWAGTADTDDIPTDRQEVFFAPAQIQKRIKAWGYADYEQRTSTFLAASAQASKQWMQLEDLAGLEALAAIHQKVAKGKVAPERGLIVRV